MLPSKLSPLHLAVTRPKNLFLILLITYSTIITHKTNCQHLLASSTKIAKSLNYYDLDSAPPKMVRATGDSVFIDFVGTGDIQKSISNGDEVNSNTGIGFLFERYFIDSGQTKHGHNRNYIQSLELEGIINIASTADSLILDRRNGAIINRRNFGTYVLNPISAKQSLFVNSNIYFGFPDETKSKWFAKFSSIISGINIRATASNNVWKYNDSTSRNLGAIAFRCGVFHEVLPDNIRLSDQKRNKYSIFVGLNYSYRGIFGDITSDSNDVIRTDVLGASQTSFSGIEANFGFRLNNIRAEFQMPVLKKREAASIDGLTDTQFIFSIKFIGGFALKLKS